MLAIKQAKKQKRERKKPRPVGKGAKEDRKAWKARRD